MDVYSRKWHLCFQPYLGFIVLEQSFRPCPTGVVRYIKNHHTLPFPTNERAIGHTLHHGQEVLIAMVTSGHYREGGPVILFKHLEDNLKLEQCGAGELEVDGTALLKDRKETP